MKSNKDSQLRTKDIFKEIYLASCDEEMAAKLDTFGRKWVVFLSVFEFLFAIPFFFLFTACFLDKEWIDVWYFIHYLKDNQTEYVEAKLRSPWHQEVII